MLISNQPNWQSHMHMPKTLSFVIAVASAVGFASSSAAQTGGAGGPTTYGSYSNSYTAPAWGQASPGAWGTYSGNVGQGGWQYNRTPQPNEPTSGVYPNTSQGTGVFTLPRRGRNPP